MSWGLIVGERFGPLLRTKGKVGCYLLTGAEIFTLLRCVAVRPQILIFLADVSQFWSFISRYFSFVTRQRREDSRVGHFERRAGCRGLTNLRFLFASGLHVRLQGSINYHFIHALIDTGNDANNDDDSKSNRDSGNGNNIHGDNNDNNIKYDDDNNVYQ